MGHDRGQPSDPPSARGSGATGAPPGANERREASERAADRGDLASLLVDSVDFAAVRLDTDGCIRAWNAGAERIFGYAAEEILGQHAAVLYTDEERSGGDDQRLLERAAAQGSTPVEARYVHKDGSIRWISGVLRAERDEAGRLRGYASITHDVTASHVAEQAMREERATLRLLIESVVDYAIFMLTPDGYIATWNPGAERLKGYRADEIIGQHFSVLYTDVDRAANHALEVLSRAAAQGRYAEEGWRVRKDGSRFWASVVVSAMRNPRGELVGFAKVTRDLTEVRRQEELRESVRSRDEFISVASHELRTPLTSLILSLEALEDVLAGGGQLQPPRALVARSLRSARRLGRLVDALLDVSRLAIGQFRLEPRSLDLRELVRHAVDDLADEAARAGCVIELDLPGEAVAGVWDPSKVEQMLFNLLANALKFGRGAPIQVRLNARSKGVSIAVTDHGIGIAPEDRQRIFQRFERAVTSRNYGGLGIGLYVTKQIAEAHGGTVRISSAPGSTTFVVDLPRWGAPADRNAGPSTPITAP